MGRIKKQRRIACIAVLFFLFSAFKAYAADKPAVVEIFTGENEIVMYLKGIQGNLADLTVQAGTTACESVAQSRLSETGQPVKTLIMLDNSKSVQQASRSQILKFVKKMISERMDNEQMALVVFNKGLEYLADYTSDETILLNALNKITYQKTGTYLTDVLYDLLSEEYVQSVEDVFYRIIIISDGMDNKEFGYTKDELEDLLKEHPVPIYTVGLENAEKDNQEQLKNMFALSRLTGADNFLLKNTHMIPKMIKSLSRDRDIVRLAAGVPEELMDGDKKMVKITFASGKSISKEAAMPQPLKTVETILEKTDTTIDIKNKESASDAEKEEKGAHGIMGRFMVILIPVVLFVLAAVVVIVKKRSRSKLKREQNYYSRQGSITGQIQGRVSAREQNMADSQKTEQISDDTMTEDDNTRIDHEENVQAEYQIMLTDMNVPSLSFCVRFLNSVTVGRAGECGLVIDYDKSVSNRHCKITVEDSRFYIIDLNSSNGTFINGQKVRSKMEIVSGDLLKIGRLTFRFESNRTDTSN